jgi:hypothetical protein
MKLAALVVVLAFGLIVPIAAVAKAPPSFAVWTAQENNYEDSLTDPVVDRCKKAFSNNDLKAGQCLVAGLLAVYPRMDANWGRGVARVAKGQPVACKRAIHAYWLAAQKNFKVSIAYFKAHQKTAVTKINSDLAAEPYLTIRDLKDEAKSKAIRVCG